MHKKRNQKEKVGTKNSQKLKHKEDSDDDEGSHLSTVFKNSRMKKRIYL